MSDDAIAGSCVCGAVRYAVQPPFLAFQYCHCSRCRKATGAPHAANLFVAAAAFSWEAGEAHVRRFELPTAKYWCNGFCAQCGSTLPWLSRTGKAWIVPAGTLDADPGIRPRHSVHWDSRAPWYASVDALDKHPGDPPRK